MDQRKTRKVLRKIEAITRAQAEGRELSAWETAFLESLSERLNQFGSAFRDPAKGHLAQPLSDLQTQKLREVAQKAQTIVGPIDPEESRETMKPARSSFSRSEPRRERNPILPSPVQAENDTRPGDRLVEHRAKQSGFRRSTFRKPDHRKRDHDPDADQEPAKIKKIRFTALMPEASDPDDKY